MCSLAARGLWVELLGYAHEAEPYGHLLVAGKAPTIAQLAALVGSTPREVERLLAELEAADVFSRAPDGVIFSRRMIRDQQRAEEGRQAVGRRWGNSSSSTDAGGGPNRGPISPPERPPSTERVEDESLSPHSRSEREGRTRSSRGTRLPEGWSPSFDSLAFALAEGLSGEEHSRELDKFADYWRAQPGAKARKVDWDATFRSWLRREADSFSGDRKGGGRRDPLATFMLGAASASAAAAARQSPLATFLEGAAAAFPEDDEERPERPANGHG